MAHQIMVMRFPDLWDAGRHRSALPRTPTVSRRQSPGGLRAGVKALLDELTDVRSVGVRWRADSARYGATDRKIRALGGRLRFRCQGVGHWSLTTLRDKLIKMGAKVVRHARYVTFQLAEVAVPRELFRAILDRIRGLALFSPLLVPG